MFDYPPSTRFGKAVPKTRIHAAASSNKRIRELFTTQVAEILWARKLSPETRHPPHLQQGHSLSHAFRNPPRRQHPLRRFIQASQRCRCHKVGDLAALHDQLIRQHLPLPTRPGETLRDHVTRVQAIEAKQREVSQLETRLHREQQFNRKVELNQRLRELREEISFLNGERTRPRVQSPAPSPETGSHGFSDPVSECPPPCREGAITSAQVRYEAVDGYGMLMDLVK